MTSGDKDCHWCQTGVGYLFILGSWEYWTHLLADEPFWKVHSSQAIVFYLWEQLLSVERKGKHDKMFFSNMQMFGRSHFSACPL